MGCDHSRAASSRRGKLERRFAVPLAHPVGAGYQFVTAHREAGIDQEEVFPLWYNRVVAPPQIADDILD